MTEKSAAVMMIDGFEESETIQIVDLLRRAGVKADTFRFQGDAFFGLSRYDSSHACYIACLDSESES